MLTSTVLYADVISTFVIRKAKKSMEIVNIDGENFHIFWTTWKEIFRKDVTNDNIKSHKKPGLHLFSIKYNLGKTIGRVKLTAHPPVF